MVSLNINIKKKDLWLLSAICVFFLGMAFVVAYNSGGPASVMGHSADELEGVCLSDGTNCPEGLGGGGGSWASEWIAVNDKMVYNNGGVDDAGNVIDLNHNLGTNSLIIQVYYAPDTGTFPTAPNEGVMSAIVGHSDSNIDWRSVHSGILLQEVQNNQIGKIIAGHESVGIWDDGDSTWNDFRKGKGWIKIVVSSGRGSGALIKTGTYTGTGAIQDIDVGFEPDSITFLPHGANYGWVGHKTKYMSGAYAKYANEYTNNLVSITPNGFRIETTSPLYYNVDGYTYSYIAMKDS
tara:strand:- start:4337 stop:5215 length:879 start_codon:yes stop_codon:yes gene_type:complete